MFNIGCFIQNSTAEKHGKNVKAKSGLNKSIFDQGWHEFRRQLEYKAKWNGGKLIFQHYYNQTFNVHVVGILRKQTDSHQAKFYYA